MAEDSERNSLNALARDARAEGRGVMWARWLAAAIIVVGALDAVSTDLALGTGLAREANPVVRFIQAQLGDLWLAPKMALHGVMAWMVTWYPNLPTLIALTAVSALAGLAAVNNFAIYFEVAGQI